MIGLVLRNDMPMKLSAFIWELSWYHHSRDNKNALLKNNVSRFMLKVFRIVLTTPVSPVVLSISYKCWCCFGSLHHREADRVIEVTHCSTFTFSLLANNRMKTRDCLKATKWFLWELFNLHLSTQSCHCPLLLWSSAIVGCEHHDLVAATWPWKCHP